MIVLQSTHAQWTYTTLKAKVALYLHRADLTDQIPDFILLAESELNTDAMMRRIITDVPLTLLSGTRLVTLPDRFMEPVDLRLNIANEGPQKPLTCRQQQQNGVYDQLSTRPKYYSISNDSIEFPNLADQDYPLVFRCIQGFELAYTETNVLLDKYPGLYLYGALVQASPYIERDARVAMWRSMYDNLMLKARRQEARSQALVRLVTDTPVSRGPRFNFFSG